MLHIGVTKKFPRKTMAIFCFKIYDNEKIFVKCRIYSGYEKYLYIIY